MHCIAALKKATLTTSRRACIVHMPRAVRILKINIRENRAWEFEVGSGAGRCRRHSSIPGDERQQLAAAAGPGRFGVRTINVGGPSVVPSDHRRSRRPPD